MLLIDTLLAKIAPYDCLSCGKEGSLLCRSCVPLLDRRLPSVCFNCQKQTTHYQFCDVCSRAVSLRSIAPAYPYTGIVKQLIKEFKFNGKRGAAKEIAQLMRVTLPEDAVLVPIPTATSRVRERGYDHAKLLAKAIALHKGLPCQTLLVRTSQHRQLGSRRSERLHAITGAFRSVGDASGMHIILVDDVVTTGATLMEAATILRASGARCVDAITFAATPQ